MTVLSEQEAGEVIDLAGKLRRIQMDAATAPAEKRRELLQEELARCLKTVPPANRKSYLTGLLARFPVAGKIVQTAPAPAPVAAAPPPPPSLDELLESLIAAAKAAPSAKREEMVDRLAQAGFVRAADQGTSDTLLADELRDRFGLAPGQQPKIPRLLDLAVQLCELCAKLDQTTFTTWNALSRNPPDRRRQDLRIVVARHLVEEGEALESRLQAISTLVGGLQVAMLKGGRDFERYYTERFAPQAIDDVVEGEGGSGFFKNKKERCWEKYCERAKDFAAPGVIEKHLNDSFVKQVETTVRSTR